MGWLKDKIGKNLLKVIEWSDNSQTTMAYKFPVEDRYAIMKNSQLIVRESQVAVFVKEGRIAEIFGPGRYKLEDIKNIPILTNLMNWKYGWETPYTGDVYFVNTKQFISQKWGTTNPVMMRDKDFGMIRIRGFGTYSFKVVDPKTFLTELFGSSSLYTTAYVTDQLKRIIVSKIVDAIGESGIPALDIAANYNELGEITKRFVTPDFNQYGMEICSLIIENISLPPEVEKTMDTRTSMGVLGDMGRYTQYQAANAIGDAAKNSGGMAGSAMGMGAGFTMGKVMADAFAGMAMSSNNNAQQNNSTPSQSAGIICSNCGQTAPAGSLFCGKCGTKLQTTKFCPACGAQVNGGDSFCGKCGKKLN